MTDPASRKRECITAAKPGAVSLTILADPKHTVRKSKMGRWRAGVLIGVHVIMVAHIIQWLIHGMTLSPIEPSESIYTLNSGLVNAGFVFFALAILATLVLGRFFCGWGCHIIAVQDLCGWMMKRVGIRPRPFRSRLLVWAPLILAVYMFLWPTLKREVIKPLVGAETWAAIGPVLGEAGERPEFKAAFMKKDFWETFAEWYIAIPFVGVCGFACVYFLGAKGFCTYGCPYGGFFGPVDRLAPGRIRVTDACEHCGHCTAVCTSNVRVHEEVRDYGMVVDPGCMKCMDCISVCPNDALYFGFGRPAAFARPRIESAQPRFKTRVYDLSWKEEVVYGAVFLLLVIGFRGMFGMVPLLMAMGMAGVGTYFLWKLVAMVRMPSVRIHGFQLKYKGRVGPRGLAFAAIAVATVALGAWGAMVNASVWRGNVLDSAIAVPMDSALAKGFAPTPDDRARAAKAARHLERAGPEGLGWDRSVDRALRLARLHAILGNLDAAEADLRRGLEASKSSGAAIEAPLIRVLGLRATSSSALENELRDLLIEHPDLASVRLSLAHIVIGQGNADEGINLIQRALQSRPDDLTNRFFAIELLIRVQRADLALEAAAEGARRHPGSSLARERHGLLLAATGKLEEGITELKAASALDPRNPRLMMHIATLFRESGRASEATDWETRANTLSPPHPGPK